MGRGGVPARKQLGWESRPQEPASSWQTTGAFLDNSVPKIPSRAVVGIIKHWPESVAVPAQPCGRRTVPSRSSRGGSGTRTTPRSLGRGV